MTHRPPPELPELDRDETPRPARPRAATLLIAAIGVGLIATARLGPRPQRRRPDTAPVSSSSR